MMPSTLYSSRDSQSTHHRENGTSKRQILNHNLVITVVSFSCVHSVQFVFIILSYPEYQYQLVVKLGRMSPALQNGTFTVTFVAKNKYQESTVKVVGHELMQPPVHGLHSHYQVNKLVLRPHSLPLSQLTAIYLSYQANEQLDNNHFQARHPPAWSSFVTIPWVKLSPIHVLNNEPIYFCHLQHNIQMGRTNLLKRCNST